MIKNPVSFLLQPTIFRSFFGTGPPSPCKCVPRYWVNQRRFGGRGYPNSSTLLGKDQDAMYPRGSLPIRTEDKLVFNVLSTYGAPGAVLKAQSSLNFTVKEPVRKQKSQEIKAT